MTTKTQDRVKELRAAIRKITGRAPVSHDVDYLEKRLGDLRRRDRDGRDAADRYMDSTTVLSISMHGAAKDATTRIAGGETLGVSELVRRALKEYAEKHGYASEVQHFAGAE